MEEPRIGILGTGSYLPVNAVTNAELAARAGTTEDWIESKTQILSRRFAAADEATSDLALRAASCALEQACLSPGQIDYVIVATSTPDSPQPPTAYHVQHGLGAYGAACFDINVVCSGFVYGLALARSLTAQRPGSHALVIGADVYSRFLDFSDRRTAVLFGDGAGAAVVGEVAPPFGFMDFELSSRGDAHHLIRIEAGGSRRPASASTLAEGGHLFRMEGRAVRDFVLGRLPSVVGTLCARAGLDPEQIDHFVPHQPNGVLLSQLVERCGLGKAHTHRTLERYGNTGSAATAVTLDAAHRQGHIRNGDIVLLAAFGGGMSLGAGLIRWRTT